MTHPTPPCAAYCNGRRVGCRSACDAWQKYEAEMVTFNASKRVAIYSGNMTSGRKKMAEHIRKKRCACV